MKAQRFQELYEKYGEEMPVSEMKDRAEMNEYGDYRIARCAGKSHEEAMLYSAEQATKFSPQSTAPKAQSEADEIYERLRESCERTALGGPCSR